MKARAVFYLYVVWVIVIPCTDSFANIKEGPAFYISDEEKCIIELLESLYKINVSSLQKMLSRNMLSESRIIRSATIKSLIRDMPGIMKLDILEKGLTDSDEEIRAHSALLIGDLASAGELKEYSKNIKVAKILLDMLDNPSARIVVSAVYALDGLDYKEALPRIIKLLAHNNPDVREWSLEYIQHNDDKKEAEEDVLKLLKDTDRRVQRTAVISTNNYPTQRVASELRSVIDDSRDGMIIIEAALALIYISDEANHDYIYKRFMNFDFKDKVEACTVWSMMPGKKNTETSKMLWDRIHKLYGECS